MKRIINCKKVEDFSGHSIRIKWVTITQFLYIDVHLKVESEKKNGSIIRPENMVSDLSIQYFHNFTIKSIGGSQSWYCADVS